VIKYVQSPFAEIDKPSPPASKRWKGKAERKASRAIAALSSKEERRSAAI